MLHVFIWRYIKSERKPRADSHYLWHPFAYYKPEIYAIARGSQAVKASHALKGVKHLKAVLRSVLLQGKRTELSFTCQPSFQNGVRCRVCWMKLCTFNFALRNNCYYYCGWCCEFDSDVGVELNEKWMRVYFGYKRSWIISRMWNGTPHISNIWHELYKNVVCVLHYC